MTLALFLFVVYSLLAVADCITTSIALKREDVYEAFGPARWMMERIGILPTLTIFTTLQLGILYWLATAGVVWWAFVPIIAWRGYVVVNNIKVLNT